MQKDKRTRRIPFRNGLFMMLGLAFAGAAGCYETYTEDPVGSLVVPYEIAYLGETCEAAGVARVVAVLDDGLYQVEADCDDYEVMFKDLSVGTYSLSLYGLDRDGVPIVDSLLEGPMEVRLSADQVVYPEKPIVLTEAPVVIQLRWALGFGSCKSRAISKFEAQVFDAQDELIMSTALPCSAVGTEEGEYRVMPDEDRLLVDPPIDHIWVQPLTKNKKSFGEAYQLLFDEIAVPGPGGIIRLTIKCSIDRCYRDGGC